MIHYLILFAFVFISFSTLAQVNLGDGLVACYSFSGNTDDGSGHNYNGTNRGGRLTTDRFGNFNNAYQFDGRDDYISIPSAPFLNKAYSYSVWIKISSIPLSGDVGNIISIGDDVTGTHQTVNVSNSYSSANFIGLSIGGYNMGNPPTTSVAAGVLPVVDQWYHITSVRTNTEMRMYINGISIGSSSLSQNPPLYGNNVNAYIAMRCNNTQPFNGSIDDVTIYNRGLSDEEVTKIYQQGLACYPTALSVPSPSLNDVSQCGNQTITLVASGGTHYKWYDAETNGNLIYEGNPFTIKNPSKTTVYYVANVVNAIESIRKKVTITIFPMPTLLCMLPDSSFVRDSEHYTVNSSGGTPPFTFNFNFGDGSERSTTEFETVYDYRAEGTYTIKVVVTDSKGCKADCLGVTHITKQELFIPNLITPNGDSFNQVFNLYLKISSNYFFYAGNKTFTMRIYNRWGEEIFYSKNPSLGWEATNVPSGVYFYAINFKNDNYRGAINVFK